ASPSPTQLSARPGPTSNNSPTPGMALPPLVTSPPSRSSVNARQSYLKNNRLSTLSQASSHFRSRPQSTVFPAFHSSLNYTLVRDFAYPTYSPLFYGPLPEQRSVASTPVSESFGRRLSDPPPFSDGSRGGWSAGPWGQGGEQLPPTSFGDGPPWSEDEDLHSPVVTSAKHKKHKSHAADFDNRGRSAERESSRGRRGSYTGTNGDGSQTFYVSDIDELANGPGGEYITYPASGVDTSSDPAAHLTLPRQESRTLPSRRYDNDPPYTPSSESSASSSSPGFYANSPSRYSRDYQFTIASPDEEMHGKAVALFDFARENDNELPLTEGQVVLISYRHGQGWLVAQDPRSGESGLVPEEYVRLLRDIEGGWTGLMNVSTPTQSTLSHPPDHRRDASDRSGTSSHHSGASGEQFYTPVVSTFSTSSRDLQKFP
ncbi:hypothetical protein K490DRAFT_23238, partial [Saccharata proteae CBS 121410]